MAEDLARIRGLFVEWFPSEDTADYVAEQLERGHPGVIVDRGPKHLDVSWIGHEDEQVSAGAVYDTTMVREIDVYTFCERVLALQPGGRATSGPELDRPG
jgi:hypothetical protein